jgi:glutamate/aspartate transport system substrate-binding protein
MVETDRAAAFFMDDILLYSLVASSKAPADYAIGDEAYTVEPYGIMLRKDDPAFQKVADNATAQLYKSGAIMPIYNKWFLATDPAEEREPQRTGGPQLKNEFANPDQQRRSGRLQVTTGQRFTVPWRQ